MEERLTVRIGANLSDFERKMSQMQGKMNDVGKSMSSIGSSMTKYITAPAAGAVAAAASITAAFGWKRLVGLDSAQAQLKGLGYEIKDVERISEQVNNAVQGTTMTMAEGTSVAAGALAAGVDEGEELEAYIKAVGNAAVGSGRDVGEMASIFNRVQGSGKLMTQELNMIEDGMPGFAQAMADSLGVGMEEFRNMVTAGEVTSDQFLTVMDDFAGDMSEAYADSWEGMVANTKAWIGILGENLLSGVFEQSKDSIGEFMELLKSDAAQEWATEMGAKISDGFGRIINTVKSVVSWWNSLSSTTQKVIGTLAGLTVAAGPVLMIFGKIMQTFTALAPLVKIAGLALGALTSPIGLVVAGIAALGAGFVIAYNKSETFRNFVDGIKDKFMTAIEWIGQFKDGIIGLFQDDGMAGVDILTSIGISQEMADKLWEFTGHFIEFYHNVKEWIDKVKTTISGIFEAFRGDTVTATEMLTSIGLSEDTITMIFDSVEGIKTIFRDMKTAVGNIFTGIKDFIVGAFTDVKSWWDADGALIFDAMGTVVSKVFEFITFAVDTALTFVIDLFNRFAPIVEGIWGVLWPTIQFLVETVWEKIKLVIGVAMDLIQGIISGVSAIIEGDWERFGEIISETASSIWTRVTEFFTYLRDGTLELFGQLFEGAIQWFSDLWTNLTEKALQIKDDVVLKFTELKDGAVSKISEMYTSITTWFSDLWTSVTTKATEIKDSVTGSFTTLKDNAINRVTNMYNSVTGWFGDLKTNATNTATNLKDGVVSKFSSMRDDSNQKMIDMYNWVTGKFGDLASWVDTKVTDMKDDTVKAFLWMKDGAIDGVQKLYDGTSDLFDDVKSYATDTFDNMVDGAKELPGRIGNAIKNMASFAVDGITSLGKSMGDRLGGVVNGVVGGLNKVLGAIGVSEIPTISISTGGGTGGASVRGASARLARFSTGTRNGAISNDMLGMVNDRGPGNGRGGATQELIQRDGQLFAPRGKNAVVQLKKNDVIYNGAQTQSMMSSGVIPRFSQGTGAEGGNSGEKKGLLGTLKDVVSDVWSYISNPGKAFEAIMSSVSPDFGGFAGFAGSLLSGGFKMVTNGIKDFITKVFKENEGALGSGKGGKWMNYRMTTPYSPNAPVPGYPRSFNNGHHYGIDYGTPMGTPITATTGGKLSSFWNEGGGLIAKLVTGQLRQFFMHMSSVNSPGSVKAGDVIGKSGNSGRWTTGPHVHWQAQQGTDALNRNTIDPRKVIGHANGGIFSHQHVANFAEEGPEAIIPLSAKRRGRANSLYDSVGKAIGRDDGQQFRTMIDNQQKQIERMDKTINVLLGIEDKTGYDPGKSKKAMDRYIDDTTIAY